jgi:hypothetical protein
MSRCCRVSKRPLAPSLPPAGLLAFARAFVRRTSDGRAREMSGQQVTVTEGRLETAKFSYSSGTRYNDSKVRSKLLAAACQVDVRRPRAFGAASSSALKPVLCLARTRICRRRPVDCLVDSYPLGRTAQVRTRAR